MRHHVVQSVASVTVSVGRFALGWDAALAGRWALEARSAGGLAAAVRALALSSATRCSAAWRCSGESSYLCESVQTATFLYFSGTTSAIWVRPLSSAHRPSHRSLPQPELQHLPLRCAGPPPCARPPARCQVGYALALQQPVNAAADEPQTCCPTQCPSRRRSRRRKAGAQARPCTGSIRASTPRRRPFEARHPASRAG